MTLHRWWLYVTILVSGVLAICLELVRGLVQAVADSLMPADALYLKAIHPGLAIHRNEVLHELADRMRKMETAATQMVMERPGENGLTSGEDAMLSIIEQAMSDRPRRERMTGAANSSRRWIVGLEKLMGTANTVHTIHAQPQVLWKGKKIVATDDSDDPGSGTEIVGIFIGNRPVTNAWAAAIPVSEFAYNKINNDLLFPTCDPALYVTIQVRFLKDCNFYCAIHGKALGI